MTNYTNYYDRRGTNVIPFGRRTLDQLRRANQMREAPPLRPLPRPPEPLPVDLPPTGKPWPFNALGPTPFGPHFTSKHDTLPPLEEDVFHFREPVPLLRVLEFDLENVILQFKFDHPGLRPLDLVPVLLGIVKKLLRQAKLPSR
jgi:hypothetical protein